MYKSEEWTQRIADAGIELIEDNSMPLDLNGIYINQQNKQPVIAYKRTSDLQTASILAEEYGHYLCGAEKRGKAWAYQELVPLYKLMDAAAAGVSNNYELSEYLEVPEGFLRDAIQHYDRKYGHIKVNNSYLYFNPRSTPLTHEKSRKPFLQKDYQPHCLGTCSA